MTRADVLENLRGRIEAIERKTAPEETAPAKRVTYKRSVSSDLGCEHGNQEHRDETQSAFSKIVALLNASDKSELVLRNRLSQCGFTNEAIDESILKAKNLGFVDDSRFAQVLIRSRIAQGKGCAGIERELLSHGIEPCDIDGWPEDFGISDGSEVERALELLNRKPPRSSNVRDGAFRKLVQKGYSSSVASSAARLWCESSPFSTDD